MKLLVRRIDLSNRPSTRSFTHSWSHHAAHPLTTSNARLAKAQYLPEAGFGYRDFTKLGRLLRLDELERLHDSFDL